MLLHDSIKEINVTTANYEIYDWSELLCYLN